MKLPHISHKGVGGTRLLQNELNKSAAQKPFGAQKVTTRGGIKIRNSPDPVFTDGMIGTIKYHSRQTKPITLAGGKIPRGER